MPVVGSVGFGNAKSDGSDHRHRPLNPDAPKVDRFITLGGEPRLLRYNSRLPLVVYVPDGVEVRYRFWRADVDATTAERG